MPAGRGTDIWDGIGDRIACDQDFLFGQIKDGGSLGVAGHTHEAKLSSAVTERELIDISERRIGAAQADGFVDEALVIPHVFLVQVALLGRKHCPVVLLAGADLFFQGSLSY